MIAITSINGVVVLLVVFSLQEASANEGPAKCYVSDEGSSYSFKTQTARADSIAASAPCSKFCMNETHRKLSTLQ